MFTVPMRHLVIIHDHFESIGTIAQQVQQLMRHQRIMTHLLQALLGGFVDAVSIRIIVTSRYQRAEMSFYC